MRRKPAFPIEGDWAPRMSLAWGLGHNKTAPKTVLRGGYGIFYDRFSYDYLLQAERYNGMTQQQYVVANPNFYPLIPTPAELAQLSTTSPTDLSGSVEPARALHHGSGDQPGASGHQECDFSRYLFELAGSASALPAQCQRAVARHLQSGGPDQRHSALWRQQPTSINTTRAASSSRTK